MTAKLDLARQAMMAQLYTRDRIFDSQKSRTPLTGIKRWRRRLKVVYGASLVHR